jgi:multiple sugar transport system permease protein
MDVRVMRPRSAGLSVRLPQAASYAAAGLACIIALLPFFYIVSTSLKETTSLFHSPPDWIPKHLYWGNYAQLLFHKSFLRWTFNTLFVATAVTCLKVVFDSMAGYAFARMEFAGKEPLFVIILATLMIPFSTILIPLFFIVRALHLLNTYWALILPPLASPIGIFMMRNFIEGLPQELANAARLDGCSEFEVYRRVFLPLIKPGLVVLGVFVFMTQYTSFLWPLVTVSNDDLRVLTTGISSLKAIFTTDWGLISAAGVLAMIPITVVFLLLQRYFIAGSLAGALKQ